MTNDSKSTGSIITREQMNESVKQDMEVLRADLEKEQEALAENEKQTTKEN